MNADYHVPVLLKESVGALVQNPDGVYVDLTFGGGGHSAEILSRLGEHGRLYAFDQDPDAKHNVPKDSRFSLLAQNFRHLKNTLRFYGVTEVDGILGDFGVSSHQFDKPERGFSTRFEGPLDMRMNPSQSLTAEKLLHEYSEEDLADIFYRYGELRDARKVARVIVQNRTEKQIKTTEALKSLFDFIPPQKKNKYFAQIFQALRIEVNAELSVIKEMLPQALDVLKKDGRLVCISYHSLEDRLVKRFLKNGMFEGELQADVYGVVERPFRLLKSGAIMPTEEEIFNNPRARSAKMRVGIKN